MSIAPDSPIELANVTWGEFKRGRGKTPAASSSQLHEQASILTTISTVAKSVFGLRALALGLSYGNRSAGVTAF